jgi:hypothetical protein
MTSLASQEGLSAGTAVSVNYDEADAINKAVKAGAFDNNWVDIDMNDIPVGGTGQAEHEVFELHLDREIYSRDLPDELDRNNVAFADPLTALRYAKELPDRQRKYPLAILFTNKKGQLCYLILLESDGKRNLVVNREDSVGDWREGCRFLVVRKSSV